MRERSLPAGLRFHHPAVLVATFFGTGLSPLAPGTIGSLAALPFAWLIHAWLGQWALVAAAAVAFAIGLWAADAYARADAERDPGAVVIDEVAGQWLTLAAVAATPLNYAVGFVLFRVVDIVKPWPASRIDRHMHGGMGIMLDDIVAAVYAGATLWVIAWVSA